MSASLGPAKHLTPRMQFIALATDYDGTLASDGKVDRETIDALNRLRASGRKLVLVTGRHLPDLQNVFPQLHLFDRVIAENGGLLYRPATREEKLLGESPNEHLVSLLRERNVPIAVGRVVVSTWQPHEATVLSAIRDLGLDLHVIFNKGAIMVLPSGVNKGTALEVALGELGISLHNVVSVGDAENDHSFLRISECAVAVANALPSLKERADVVLGESRGAGAADLIERLIADDLQQFEPELSRHSISLGVRLNEGSEPVRFRQRGGSVLVAGPSASGKSSAVSGILEQLVQLRYQFCLLDLEGDYDNSPGVLSFGTANEQPDTKAALRVLELPEQSVLINLLGVPLQARPGFFSSLLPPIQELRFRSAHPHWLVVDEAHHLMPSSWSPPATAVSEILDTAILITVHPEHVAKAALDRVNVVVAVGKQPMKTFRSFCKVAQIPPPEGNDFELATGEALAWFRNSGQAPIHVKTIQSTKERRRHVRQYAEGELSPEESFYFRGPQLSLNLRAQNLKVFLQLAEGIDDATWTYHLRRGHYSSWFRTMIKDDELARSAAEVERDSTASPQGSRQKIKEAITSRYTAPA